MNRKDGRYILAFTTVSVDGRVGESILALKVRAAATSASFSSRVKQRGEKKKEGEVAKRHEIYTDDHFEISTMSRVFSHN